MLLSRVEAEAEPDAGVLAVRRHVSSERRRDEQAETGGGDIHRPVAAGQPGRPGATRAGRNARRRRSMSRRRG